MLSDVHFPLSITHSLTPKSIQPSAIMPRTLKFPAKIAGNDAENSATFDYKEFNTQVEALDASVATLLKSEKFSPTATIVIQQLQTLLSFSAKQLKKAAGESIEEHNRRHEVVVMNLPESAAIMPTARAIADMDAVKGLFDAAGVEALPIAVYRMGKREEDGGRGYKRLLKIRLPTTAHVRTLLRNQRQIQDIKGMERVKIRPSMSREERDARKVLVEECAAKRKEDGLEWIVYAGRVMLREDVAKFRR